MIEKKKCNKVTVIKLLETIRKVRFGSNWLNVTIFGHHICYNVMGLAELFFRVPLV